MQRCPASFAICLQQLCIQLGLVNFSLRMDRTLLYVPSGCTVGCRVPPRQNGSLHLCCKMEVRKRPREWRSFRPACLARVCVSELSVVVAQGRQPCLAEPMGLVCG